jgi:hypothetical protein
MGGVSENRKPHKVDTCHSPSSKATKVVKSKGVGLAGQKERMGAKSNAYSSVVWKPEVESPLNTI